MPTKEITTTYYCPICYKELPEEAYHGRYMGCIEFLSLDKETGLVCTGQGTIKLGTKPDGGFGSMLPKEMFDSTYNAIREKQQSGSVRIGRCK